jgi:hypothetical protein
MAAKSVSPSGTRPPETMFAAGPLVFLPWDDPIRRAFGWPGGGAAYVELLRLSAAALMA